MNIFDNFKRNLLLSLGISAFIFLTMAFYANFHELIKVLRLFNWLYLPIVLAMTFCNLLLRFFKWDFYLSQLAIPLGKKDSLTIFFSGLVMTVTPAKMGEVVKSYLLKQKNGTAMSLSAPIIVAERLTDFIALALLSTIGVITFHYGQKALAFMAFILMAAVVGARSKKIAMMILEPLTRLPILSNHAKRLFTAHQSIHALVASKNLLWATFLSLLGWLCECTGFLLVIKGFNVSFDIVQAVSIYSFATIMGAMLMMPGGLGATEASLTGLLIVTSNLSKAFAVSSTLLIRVCTLWFAVLLGSIVLLKNKDAWKTASEEEALNL